MIKAVIVENEIKQVEYLNNLLAKHFPEIEIIAICNSVPDGINKIIELRPELVFLDVELPPHTGFDLLEQTKGLKFEVIFITGYSQYASKAIRFCALDFIAKPFGLDDLKESISRYKEVADNGRQKNIDALLHNIKQVDISLQKVGIPVLKGYDFITVSDIILCRASNNYTVFCLTGHREITATKTLKWVEELMRYHPFFRVHDSFLINLNHINSYEKGGEGGVVRLTERHDADVSRRRKDDFIKVLADRNMILLK